MMTVTGITYTNNIQRIPNHDKIRFQTDIFIFTGFLTPGLVPRSVFFTHPFIIRENFRKKMKSEIMKNRKDAIQKKWCGTSTTFRPMTGTLWHEK